MSIVRWWCNDLKIEVPVAIRPTILEIFAWNWLHRVFGFTVITMEDWHYLKLNLREIGITSAVILFILFSAHGQYSTPWARKKIYILFLLFFGLGSRVLSKGPLFYLKVIWQYILWITSHCQYRISEAHTNIFIQILTCLRAKTQ